MSLGTLSAIGNLLTGKRTIRAPESQITAEIKYYKSIIKKN